MAVLQWITTPLVGSTMPELGLATTISASTIATAVLLGVVAVAVAPVLTDPPPSSDGHPRHPADRRVTTGGTG